MNVPAKGGEANPLPPHRFAPASSDIFQGILMLPKPTALAAALRDAPGPGVAPEGPLGRVARGWAWAAAPSGAPLPQHPSHRARPPPPGTRPSQRSLELLPCLTGTRTPEASSSPSAGGS